MFKGYIMKKYILVFIVLLSACQNNPTVKHYGDNKPYYSDINNLHITLKVENKNESELLFENEFLEKKIINNVIAELKQHYIIAKPIFQNTANINTDMDNKFNNFQYYITLSPVGFSQTQKITLDTSYRAGMKSVNKTHNYSVPTTGKHMSTEVKVKAILYKKITSTGEMKKIGIAYADGDGMNYMERQLNKSGLTDKRDLGKLYSKKFIDATLALFNFNNPNDKNITPITLGKSDFKTVKYANGDRYEGMFLDNLKTGQGVYYFSNGNKYVGNFSGGTFNGQGIYHFKNGDKLKADYIDGLAEGHGLYYFKNGNRFEGRYLNGNKVGKGTDFYLNGDKYTVNYSDGKENDIGTYFYQNGKIEKGNFINGKFKKAN